jgi:hypothetical protein
MPASTRNRSSSITELLAVSCHRCGGSSSLPVRPSWA